MRPALIILPLLALLAGCPDAPEKTAAEKPAEPAKAIPIPAGVQEACARCHAFPPARSLPRARWAKLIPQMAGMELPQGTQPLQPAEVEAALAYYAVAAPLALPRPPPSTPLSKRRERFDVEEFTPPGLEKRKIPAVANLTFARMFHAKKLDLFVCEMRTRALFHLAPWASGKARRMRPLQRELNYPCHVELSDMDGDGRQDLLIASLGAMNPTNAKQGSISILLRRGKRFSQHQVAAGLGRVADVQAADFDGDGDLDLVAAEFGWRGPGRLVLYERTSAGRLQFTPRVLDTRDGFIHLAPTDLDGDGDLDLVALLSQEHEQVLVFLNQGQLKFKQRVLYKAPHPAWGFSGMQLVDIDGDDDLDVLLSNGDALDDDLIKGYHGVSWLENPGKGIGEFKHHRILHGMPGCERAVAGDLDGDGDLDVLAVSFLPQLTEATWKKHDLASVVWIEQVQKHGWQPHTLEKHRCIHPTAALGDYNGDGKLDIAVGNYVWVQPGGTTHTPSEYVTLFTAR